MLMSSSCVYLSCLLLRESAACLASCVIASVVGGNNVVDNDDGPKRSRTTSEKGSDMAFEAAACLLISCLLVADSLQTYGS